MCIHDERLACLIPLLERYKQPHQVRYHSSEEVLSAHIQVSSVGRESIEELRRGLADAFQVMDRGLQQREEGVVVRRGDASSSYTRRIKVVSITGIYIMRIESDPIKGLPSPQAANWSAIVPFSSNDLRLSGVNNIGFAPRP